ncbi:MAG: DUF3047 domain-containing protein [Candidatus Aminicenantaceae bacterium]
MKGARALMILRRGTDYLLLFALVLVPGRADSIGSRALFIQDSEAQVREIVSFPEEKMSVLEWMRQSGWEEQKGSAEPFFIEDGALYMRSTASSTTIGKKLRSEIDPDEFPEIEFSFRVDEVPPDADVTNRKKDDAAFRLFVLFDKGGILSVTPPHTIGYVWDSTLKQGETGRAANFGQVRYIVIGSGSEGTGDWTTIRRNIRDDYKLLFGKDRVPGIKAVGLKCDSNHTKTRSASSVRFIRFIGPDRQPD